jgi:hypothetical protein
MEYADILERHKLLFGESPFEGIRVDRQDLRLQLEQEAMGKLIKLRQGVLASGNDQRRQVELLSTSLSAIMIIFRAFLRLQGGLPPKDNVALAEEVASLAAFDAEPFRRVVRHVRGDGAIPQGDAGRVLDGYLGGMERLVGYLDRFDPAA